MKTMTEKSYKPYLDGLRGLSILIVAISHGGLGKIIPGGLGLTIFFFISGYLITSLLLKEKEMTGSIHMSNFYMRRLWRLLPALLVYIAVTSVVSLILGEKLHANEALSAVFYYSNYYKLFIHYTPMGGVYSPYDVLWSLAVEEHFYLFFAPLIAFVKNKKTMLTTVVVMLVAPVLVRALVTQFTSADFSDEYTYRATESRMDSIAYGCLLAMVGYKSFFKLDSRRVFLVGCAGLVASLLFRDEYFRQVFRYSWQGLCLYLVFGEIIYSEKLSAVRFILSGRFIVLIGKLSYSIYLYHWLALILMIMWFGGTALTPVWQLSYWGFSLVLSVASYFMVERPTLKLRVKYGSNVQ